MGSGVNLSTEDYFRGKLFSFKSMCRLIIFIDCYQILMEKFDYCPKCGSHHEDDCPTQAIYFYWQPSPEEVLPQEVNIIGDWTHWVKKQKLTKVSTPQGLTTYCILLALSEGRHEYKFLVDGVWKYDRNEPTAYNCFGTLNNVVEILPKKSFIKKNMGERVKITSNFCMPRLVVVGSWDNWSMEHPMIRQYNPLKKCQQNVIYLDLQPQSPYEFIFKHKHQYFVDEKYPTVINQFGTLNNSIVVYSKQITTNTPRKTDSSPPAQVQPLERQIKCKMFSWKRIEAKIDLPYERVEGHTMCYVGEYLYIFGGKSRNEFVNTFLKINNKFDKVWWEEVLPDGRAYHTMKAYGNKILVYGGHNTQILDDYNAFNVSSQKWMNSHHIPKINGSAKYEKQSCVLYESLLVFFGGYYNDRNTGFQSLSYSIEVLNLQTMQWVEFIELEGEYPAPRVAHTAELINSDMYIFGGICDLPKSLKLNDLWRINLLNVNNMVWQRVKPRGTPPQPRHGHSMNNLSNLLIIFGGINQKNEYLNDVAIYNLTVNEWIVPLIQGCLPRARVNHASANFFDNSIVIFGGRTSEKGKNNQFYLFEPTDFQSKPIVLFEEEEDSDKE